MNVLITGGTGFIGGRISQALLESGKHNVTITGRKQPRSPLSGATYKLGDLADATFTNQVTQNIEAVVHSAGMAGTWGPYHDYFRANVRATENLLKGAKANGVRRVINISSPSIYFDFKDQFNLRETDRPKKFSNAYAQTKYEAELLMHQFHSSDLQTISLRPRSVIGRGDQNVLPRLIRLQQSGNLVQVGHGENTVDITSIGNVIHACSLCLEAPASAMGETYNITNGAPVKFWDFVEEVLKEANLPVQRKKLPYAPVMAAAQLNEFFSKVIKRKSEPALLPISVGIIAFSMTLDLRKAREKLGYTPRFTTRDGILEYFNRKIP